MIPNPMNPTFMEDLLHGSSVLSKSFTAEDAEDAEEILNYTSYAYPVIPGLTRNPLAFKHKNGSLLEFIPTCRGRNDKSRGFTV